MSQPDDEDLLDKLSNQIDWEESKSFFSNFTSDNNKLNLVNFEEIKKINKDKIKWTNLIYINYSLLN